jgi:lipopolysaccharide export system protein LptA
MRWQKPARLAIAVFVVAFAVVVALALRRGKQPPPAQVDVKREHSGSVSEAGRITYKYAQAGKTSFALSAGTHSTYPDGRSQFTGGVKVESERNGRHFTIESREAEILPVKEGSRGIKTGRFIHDVRLTTEDGLSVTAAEGSYDDTDGVVTIPGPVEFAKSRLKGRGVGATYDTGKEVLWLLASAHVTVAPDETGGGAMEADARSAGLARADHYARLMGEARINTEGRVIRADDVTIRLTDDDKRVQGLELRGNSRIDGGSGGPQSMAANDIDLTYGEDGKALQSAKLMENAQVQLAGSAGGAGRRVSGRNIDIALAADGKTVTNLTSTERAQVDLPAEGTLPARQINSDTLVAGGTPEGGLQEATFAGNVVFRETRAAQGELAAIDRTAKSMRLVAKTKPGFGAIEQADFRGNFTFTDAERTSAEAPHAVYHVETERIDLSPSEDPGPAPMVSDGRIEVRARTIEFTITGRRLKADTAVRSSMQPQKKTPAAGEPKRLPSLLKQDETVNVTSNRLEYDGAASSAHYTGDARLWQGNDTVIRAGTIVLDDKNGNLTAREKVETRMMVEHLDTKTKERKRVQQIGRAETFEYNDAARQATYTTSAYVEGPEGVVTAERIVLHLKEKASELEKAEAFEKVTLKEGVRLVQGSKMVYTASNDTYVITGPPVLIIEEKPKCNEMMAMRAVYERTTGSMKAEGADANTKSQPCTGKRLF